MADPYDAAVGGGLLGGGFQGFSPLTQFGLGLLAQSGPSLTPQSPWQAIGRAGQYTSQAQDQAMQNQLIRAKLAESARETQASADVQKYILGAKEPLVAGIPNEVLAAGLRADPTAFSKLLPQQQTMTMGDMLLAESRRLENQAKETESAAGAGDNSLIYRNATMATDAINYLESVPGGTSVLVNPGALPILRKLKETGLIDPGSVGADVASTLSRIPKDQIGHVLDAAEAVEKARSNISTMQTSSNRSVMGLQTRLTGLASGAGPEVQRTQFGWAADTSKAMANAAKWDLPEVGDFPWRAGQPPPQQAAAPTAPAAPAAPPIVPQEAAPGGVAGFSMMPPGAEAAPAAEAPKPRSTLTLRYNAAGKPTFRSETEFSRYFKAGLIQDGTEIELNGQPVRVRVTP